MGASETWNNDHRYRALVEELALGSCVLFMGAGLSIGAGLPGWRKLLKELNHLLQAKLGPPRANLLDYAERLDMAKGRNALGSALNALLDTPEARPTEVHRALLRLPFSAVFTTNYDHLIEKALDELGIRYDAIRYDEEVGVIDERQALPVIKFHGDLEDPPGITLTRTDYELQDQKHPAFTPLFEALLATRTFVFVGFALNDPHFLALHETVQRALGRYRRKAYAIIPADQEVEPPALPQVVFLPTPLAKIDRALTNMAADAMALMEPTAPAAAEMEQLFQRRIKALPESLRGFEDCEPFLEPKPKVDPLERAAIHQLLQEMQRRRAQHPKSWRRLGLALYNLGDYRAALRAFGHASIDDVKAARAIARCHLYLGQKWRTRRVLQRLAYHDAALLKLNQAFIAAWPGDVSLYAHTCNWEAAEHLERKRFHRAHTLAYRGYLALTTLDALRPKMPRGYRWVRKYLHNHIGRARLLMILAGDPVKDHRASAEKRFLKAIQAAQGDFPQAWSNLLDLYAVSGETDKADAFRRKALRSRKPGLLAKLRSWRPNDPWPDKPLPRP